MAKLYKHTGEITEIKPANGKKFALEELQGFVGGYVEMLPCNDRKVWINEEGLLLGLPTNRLFPWLVGNVIITEKGE